MYVQRASELGLDHSVVWVTSSRPVLVVTWPGLQPSSPSLLLNSHMDVVPVFPEHWTHPPFAAHKVRLEL